MKLTFDAEKRDATYRTRGLRFEDAVDVFAGVTLELPDRRRDYGEVRIRTIGLLGGRMMMVVWTPRGDARHIMSMRKCNEREQAKFSRLLAKAWN